jgi:hypothetical protein
VSLGPCIIGLKENGCIVWIAWKEEGWEFGRGLEKKWRFLRRVKRFDVGRDVELEGACAWRASVFIFLGFVLTFDGVEGSNWGWRAEKK